MIANEAIHNQLVRNDKSYTDTNPFIFKAFGRQFFSRITYSAFYIWSVRCSWKSNLWYNALAIELQKQSKFFKKKKASHWKLNPSVAWFCYAEVKNKRRTHRHEWELEEDRNHVHLEYTPTSLSSAVAADCEDW